MLRLHEGIERIYSLQDWIVDNVFREYGVSFAYFAFGFVFFYFGLQKPFPVESPVRQSVGLFVYQFDIPLREAIVFIGFYEMVVGVLFFFKKLRAAFLMFLPHQLVTFLVLVTVPYTFFQPPWLDVLGMQIPWVLDSFSAFIFKNLIFVAGFALLTTIEFEETDASEGGNDE